MRGIHGNLVLTIHMNKRALPREIKEESDMQSNTITLSTNGDGIELALLEAEKEQEG